MIFSAGLTEVENALFAILQKTDAEQEEEE